ncbi:MAG: phage major capsid protein [Clostridia bacterium]|nr:phage major capsid protein [Clostridia bacterium]
MLEGGSIPLQDGVNDFTRYAVDSHKLAVFVKLDDDFVHDAAFSLEDYLTERLAKNLAKSEDKGFVLGAGEHIPGARAQSTAKRVHGLRHLSQTGKRSLFLTSDPQFRY